MRKYLLATVAALAITTSANADTFNIFGTNGNGETISGTVDADVAFTTITSVDLHVTGIYAGDYSNSFFYPTNDSVGNTYLALQGPLVYLSFPGGPSLNDFQQEIYSSYLFNVAADMATYDPTIRGTDLICQAFVLAQRSAAMDHEVFIRNESFPAVATPAAVPGPIVGAGIPGILTMLGLFGYGRFRRNQLAG
jgi:hypothetical protein